MELHGKIAVVTGASSGIGEATANALARAGMVVYAVARREQRLKALAAADARIVPHPADVTLTGDVAALAERVGREQGACHVLVNNAGATFGGEFSGRHDLDGLARTMDLNFMGTVRCMAEFADLLFSSAPARVVNVASVAGKIGTPYPAYSASKFAVVGWSESVDVAWRPRGVTVTQLNPGYVVTEGFPQEELMRTPLRRIVATPDTVAAAIVDAARHGPRERTVPRWYRPAIVLRHLAPPVVWAALKRFR